MGTSTNRAKPAATTSTRISMVNGYARSTTFSGLNDSHTIDNTAVVTKAVNCGGVFTKYQINPNNETSNSLTCKYQYCCVCEHPNSRLTRICSHKHIVSDDTSSLNSPPCHREHWKQATPRKHRFGELLHFYARPRCLVLCSAAVRSARKRYRRPYRPTSPDVMQKCSVASSNTTHHDDGQTMHCDEASSDAANRVNPSTQHTKTPTTPLTTTSSSAFLFCPESNPVNNIGSSTFPFRRSQQQANEFSSRKPTITDIVQRLSMIIQTSTSKSPNTAYDQTLASNTFPTKSAHDECIKTEITPNDVQPNILFNNLQVSPRKRILRDASKIKTLHNAEVPLLHKRARSKLPLPVSLESAVSETSHDSVATSIPEEVIQYASPSRPMFSYSITALLGHQHSKQNHRSSSNSVATAKDNDDSSTTAKCTTSTIPNCALASPIDIRSAFTPTTNNRRSYTPHKLGKVESSVLSSPSSPMLCPPRVIHPQKSSKHDHHNCNTTEVSRPGDQYCYYSTRPTIYSPVNNNNGVRVHAHDMSLLSSDCSDTHHRYV